jgi:CRISPR-associated protein Cmr2
MSGRHVLAVALGPVGSFIAAGRRSRDLWYGSRFLSEVTRVAAKALEEQGVELAVPLSSQLHTPFLSPESYQGPTISNKILGILATSDVGPKEVLRATERKVRELVAAEMKGLLDDRRLVRVIVREYVRKQAEAIEHGDFVEFYGAWAAIDGGPDAEARAIARASTLLADRKATRIFTAPAAVGAGVPKSSLDPGRDSVLIEIDPRSSDEVRVARRLEVRRVRAGIRPEERLDAVALARRRAIFSRVPDADLGKLPFPSLGRVALEPWIEGALAGAPEAMASVLATLAQLDEKVSEGDAALFFLSSPVRDPGPRQSLEAVRRFGYDPNVLFEGAIPALRKALEAPRRLSVYASGVDELAQDDGDAHLEGSFDRARHALQALTDPVAELHRKRGAPQPYYALLEADGDGVGRLLARANTHEIRQQLVQALYDFSAKAWDVIEQHQGCAFYVGGDELAAYLPADRAMSAVATLAAEFASIVGDAVADLLPASVTELGPATLTSGVAIAHVRDDLRVVRAQAHGALEDAKARRREALDGALKRLKTAAPLDPKDWGWAVVREFPRGGSTRPSGGRTAELAEFHGILCALLESEDISLSLAHALLADAQSMERLDGKTFGLDLARARLGQKDRRSDRGQATMPELTRLQQRLTAVTSWGDVRGLAAEILLAERVVRVKQQRNPERGASP